MSRSKWKAPYTASKSLKNQEECKKSYERVVISRNAEILPGFIEKTFRVHNGKKYVETLVIEEMIGHKFGEFSATRKRFFFKKKKTKK